MNVYTTHPPTHVYTEKKFKKKTILILEVHDVPDIRALFQRVHNAAIVVQLLTTAVVAHGCQRHFCLFHQKKKVNNAAIVVQLLTTAVFSHCCQRNICFFQKKNPSPPRLISKKILKFFSEISNSHRRIQTAGYGFGFSPGLNKITA